MQLLKITAAIGLLSSVVAAASPPVVSTMETALPTLFNGPLYQNFISSVNGTVTGTPRPDGGAVTLPWRYYASTTGATKNTIVMVNGHTESFIRYRETIYDFNQNGFNVLTYDHRGQGFATRLGCTPDYTSDVDSFANYITDMDAIVQAGKAGPASGHNLLLWAHSMGGGIGAGYLENYPTTFKAAVLSSPMLSLNTDPYPAIAALPLDMIVELFGGPCVLAPGQQGPPSNAIYGTNATSFANAVTTSSFTRFSVLNQPYWEFPSTMIGGVDARWISQSMLTIQQIAAAGSKASIPIQMHQSGNDAFVTPDGQNLYCNGLSVLGIPVVKGAKQCNLIKHPTSRHEVHNEVDAIRTGYMQQVITFLRQYSV
ncbi:hypothetical protein HDU87_003617 [Geranomyces variabilis]|uniref:Serine aminopeptidase S33 domain-containing protein n=1 Tax=Geranomyces variabilis TaxID=109894 RepID=A0AAD5TJB3_9FUNG|nr:hypothetical protein HDU87_003617 [Geranomyces variabilis]